MDTVITKYPNGMTVADLKALIATLPDDTLIRSLGDVGGDQYHHEGVTVAELDNGELYLSSDAPGRNGY